MNACGKSLESLRFQLCKHFQINQIFSLMAKVTFLRILILLNLTVAFPLMSSAQVALYSENFSGSPANTWTDVSVLGNSDQWTLTGGYMSINGFESGTPEPDEDWLISPVLDLSTATGETFSFKYRDRFDGFPLQLFYTTSYAGNPTAAANNWQPLAISLTNQSSNSTTPNFLTHPDIDLSSINSANVRLAFKYTTNPNGTTNAGNAEEWHLDDLIVSGNPPCIAPSTQATALTTSPSNTSASISWTKGNGSNTLVLINTTNSFTPPVNGSTYTANAAYSGSGQQTIYAGTASSVNVTGLTASTTYYIQVYNFQTCVTPIVYVTPALTGTFTTTNATSMTCAEMRQFIRNTYYTPFHTSLGYDEARRKMYGVCDNQGGTVTCVYGGYVANHPANSTATSVTSGSTLILNAEHTVPQSFFDQIEPLRGDMHHLFPTVVEWNGDRSNFPFAEIPDNQTNKWEKDLNTEVIGTIPSSNINDYSEYRTGTSYEPREVQKGNTARAIFYFYTVYESQMNNTYGQPITTVGDVQTLYNWHVQDPATAADVTRNNCIAGFQGNGNPFIDDPSLVAKAFLGSSAGCLAAALPVTLRSFSGTYKNNNAILNWTNDTEINFSHYDIERSTDGKNFTKIAKVNGTNARDYRFEDSTLAGLQNVVYYRLKMVDKDSTSEFSRIISVQIAGNTSTTDLRNRTPNFTLAPNPANETITLSFKNNQEKTTTVRVIDLLGKVWLTQNFDNAFESKALNINSLPNGYYLIQAQADGLVGHQKLMISR